MTVRILDYICRLTTGKTKNNSESCLRCNLFITDNFCTRYFNPFFFLFFIQIKRNSAWMRVIYLATNASNLAPLSKLL